MEVEEHFVSEAVPLCCEFRHVMFAAGQSTKGIN
jgi:hypothetical protein